MHESWHLVALDKPFSQRFPLFIVRLSILSHSYPLCSVECKTKMTLSHIPLSWAHFYFSLSSFPNVKHLIIFWSPPSPWPSSSSTTWHGIYFMSTHFTQWLVPKFHQLSKTKLGLSTSRLKSVKSKYSNICSWGILTKKRFKLVLHDPIKSIKHLPSIFIVYR
jgi:hypothetical protein